jgi:hypothetical protein
MNRLLLRLKQNNRGQSFIELALVLGILLLLLTGLVEFGNLLNKYINIVDGAREGARFGSNDDPFLSPDFFEKIDKVIEGESTFQSPGALAPLLLKHDGTDDVLISYFSVTQGGGVERFGVGGSGGGPWSRYGSSYTSKFSATDIQSTSTQTGAPSSGVLVVEIYYNYDQLLKLPFFVAPPNGIGPVPDPVLVYAYSIMPLSAAEPTPLPH